MLARINNRQPDIFNDIFFRDFMPGVYRNNQFKSLPAINISEGDSEFTIEIAAPGLSKKDFSINLEKNCLTISSMREEQSEENNDHYRRKEFNYDSFSRSFTLPESVDNEKIKASHKDGILYVSIPKKEEAKEKPARQIAIS